MSAQIAVLTGCTRGIGRALFEWFVAEGFLVAGCGTNVAHVDALRRAYPKTFVSVVDVCQEEAVAAWLEKVVSIMGRIDVLICNAGVLPSPGNCWEIPAAAWSAAYEVNVLGTARVLRHAVPQLRAPGARVILMSSRYGRSVVCGQGCYSATKWSTEAIAKTTALELRDRGVTVVSLDPGLVDTDMFRKSNPCGADWGQRAPADFARDAGPFVLSLKLADTGRNLVCPGSPPSYFHTGVAYKDRPAWANGFGAFRRTCDDPCDDDRGDALAQLAKRRRVEEERSCAPESSAGVEAAHRAGQSAPLRYFISGVMLGSKHQLRDSADDLVPQDYRGRVARAIRRADPGAVIVEPLDVVTERATAAGMTLGELSQHDAMVRESFGEVVDLARECDVVISNLPEASMGSAVELWEASKAGRTVLTVSPMKDNWLLRSVTHHNFADLEDLEQNLSAHIPKSASSPTT